MRAPAKGLDELPRSSDSPHLRSPAAWSSRRGLTRAALSIVKKPPRKAGLYAAAPRRRATALWRVFRLRLSGGAGQPLPASPLRRKRNTPCPVRPVGILCALGFVLQPPAGVWVCQSSRPCLPFLTRSPATRPPGSGSASRSCWWDCSSMSGGISSCYACPTGSSRTRSTACRVTGQENVPDDGPALLICNHISHIDAGLIFASPQTARTFRRLGAVP